MKQLTKRITISVLIIIVLLSVCFVGNLVWGKTLRMSRANHDLTSGRTAAARKTYEDLAVDLPESPYVLHNLGLAAYQQGDYQRAAEYFQKALENLKKRSGASKELTAKCHYHLGNAQFKLAETGKNGNDAAQQPQDLYANALAAFRSAIEANPTDQDAKYNYELTKLRRDEAQSEKQPDQNQKDQNQKDQKKDGQQRQESDQNQPDQKKQSGQSQKENSSKSQDQKGNDHQKQATPGQAGTQKNGMTKQEAQALLNAAENGDQYMAPMIRDNAAVQKDW